MGVLYAEVIGDPIAHSKSPLIHNFWLEKLGIDAEYRACRVRADELGAYFAQRRGDAEWRGCNVTMPHKRSVAVFADAIDPIVREIGASNCLYIGADGLRATNTDGAGVLAAMPVVSPPICVIGSGGAARMAVAMIDPIHSHGLRLLVRDRQRGKAMLADLGRVGTVFDLVQSRDAMSGCGGVVNATPLGMAGQEPMPKEILDAVALTEPDAFVFDMVYEPLETQLLARARSLGRSPRDGLVMLIGQAASAFEHFFRCPAPREHDAELRAMLSAC
jgi:shikimate dehydrogenase